jgi:hypothetical protein
MLHPSVYNINYKNEFLNLSSDPVTSQTELPILVFLKKLKSQQDISNHCRCRDHENINNGKYHRLMSNKEL